MYLSYKKNIEKMFGFASNAVCLFSFFKMLSFFFFTEFFFKNSKLFSSILLGKIVFYLFYKLPFRLKLKSLYSKNTII